MKVYEFLKYHQRDILNALIITQCFAPRTTRNEDNIENSLEYEKALADAFKKHILQVGQELGKGHTKKDCVYSEEPLTEIIIKYLFDSGKVHDLDSFELKTLQGEFTKIKNAINALMSYITIIWYKSNGKKVPTTEELVDACPDGLLVYLKFSEHKRVGASLGYIEKPTLLRILSDETRGNRDQHTPTITVYKEDFSWFITENDIPIINEQAYVEIEEFNARQLKEKFEYKRKMAKKYITGETINLDQEKNPFVEQRKKAIRLPNIARIQKYVDEGLSNDDIFRKINSARWSFVSGHADSYRVKKCVEEGLDNNAIFARTQIKWETVEKLASTHRSNLNG